MVTKQRGPRPVFIFPGHLAPKKYHLPPPDQRPSKTTLPPRENWLIYRGPNFLAVIWLGSSPTPLPRPANCLSFSTAVWTRCENYVLIKNLPMYGSPRVVVCFSHFIEGLASSNPSPSHPPPAQQGPCNMKRKEEESKSGQNKRVQVQLITFFPVLRIWDVYPGSWFFTYPGSQIPDLGSRIQKQQQKRGVKKNLLSYFFCSHKFHKIEYYFILKCRRKNFGPIFKEFLKVLPKKFHYALKCMDLGSGIRDLGSEIRDPEKTYSGSRIQGQKGIGSRIRIRNPGFFRENTKKWCSVT